MISSMLSVVSWLFPTSISIILYMDGYRELQVSVAIANSHAYGICQVFEIIQMRNMWEYSFLHFLFVFCILGICGKHLAIMVQASEWSLFLQKSSSEGKVVAYQDCLDTWMSDYHRVGRLYVGIARTRNIIMVIQKISGRVCRVELCTELFYAIVSTLFNVLCWSSILNLVTFLMFF